MAQQESILQILADILRDGMGYGKSQCRILLREIEEIFRRQDDPPEDFEVLRAFGIAAYKRYIAWFGMPKDHRVSIEIRQGHQMPLSYCAYNRLLKRYLIVLSRKDVHPVRRLEIIAHEMYHRVTMRNQTGIGGDLSRELWVTEMMAQMTAFRFLREQGHGEYINRCEQHYRNPANVHPSYKNPDETINFSALKHTKRRSLVLGNAQGVYDSGFESAVIRLGLILSNIVGWEHFCRLVHAKTLEEWITPLTGEKRTAVCHLLDIADFVKEASITEETPNING